MTAPEALTRRRSSVVGVIALAVCVVVGGALLNRQPPRVASITVRNGTEFDVAVDVADASRDGWVSLMIVAHKSSENAREVIDHGEEWTFRFTAQGVAAGELRVRRDVLKARGWIVDIPASVGERLRAAGAPPSP